MDHQLVDQATTLTTGCMKAFNIHRDLCSRTPQLCAWCGHTTLQCQRPTLAASAWNTTCRQQRYIFSTMTCLHPQLTKLGAAGACSRYPQQEPPPQGVIGTTVATHLERKTPQMVKSGTTPSTRQPGPYPFGFATTCLVSSKVQMAWAMAAAAINVCQCAGEAFWPAAAASTYNGTPTPTHSQRLGQDRHCHCRAMQLLLVR